MNYLKSMHKCTSYGPDKLNLWPFDLQVWPWPSTYLNKCFKWQFYSSRRTIIFKSMHADFMALTSSIYDHSIIWPSSMILTFNVPVQMFQTALLLCKEKNCGNFFRNPCINVCKLWPGQAQFRTICSSDLQVWRWPSTYLNKCFRWHFYS